MTINEFIHDFPKSRQKQRLQRILRMIWARPGICRFELAEEFGVSKVAIKKDIDFLLEKELISEKNPVESRGGRRPIPLCLRDTLFYSIGIYLSREKLILAIHNAASELLWHQAYGNDPEESSSAKFSFITKTIKKILAQLKISTDDCLGAGLCLPGILDIQKGVVISSDAFRNNKNVPIVDILQKLLGMACFLINDSDLLALIEHRWGKAAHMESFLYFTYGYGLGMILNGQLYQGHQGTAGEVNFVRVRDYGNRDIDGRIGTLYSVVPFYNITATIAEIIEKGGETKVKKFLTDGKAKVQFGMVLQAIKDGDQLCAQIIAEYFEVIGEMVLNLAYIFNPEAIFLDPWTGECPEYSLDIVKRIMGHYGVHNWCLSTQILPAEYGKDDLGNGAALLPGERVLV